MDFKSVKVKGIELTVKDLNELIKILKNKIQLDDLSFDLPSGVPCSVVENVDGFDIVIESQVSKKWLIDYMSANNMTIETLATATGFSAPYIYKMLDGSRPITEKFLNKIMQKADE